MTSATQAPHCAFWVEAPPVRLAGRLRVQMQRRGYALVPGDGATPLGGFALTVVAVGRDGAWVHPDDADALPDGFARLLSAELGARVTTVVEADGLCAYEVALRGEVVERLAARGTEILEDQASPHAGAVAAGAPLAERLVASGLDGFRRPDPASSGAPRGVIGLRFAPVNAKPPSEVLEIDPLVTCPACGAPTCARQGPYGAFYGCVRFPACRGRRTVAEAARLRSGGDASA